ncbi:cell division protein SepF, partial [Leucobacter sp. OLCS4]
MSNPLKKTMVFLGLAEDELEETGERPAPAPAAET